MPEPHFLIIACLAATLVGLSKGGIPAIGMLAVPLLSLHISPVKAAALLLPIYVLTDAVGVWLYRKHFSKPNLAILLPAGLLGVLLGWSTASYLSDRAIGLLLGCIGVAFCLHAWFRSGRLLAPQAPAVGKGLWWGTMAGFTSFV
ncbi:MAG: TSUP family transporter, partial [Rhodoferax sp.]